MELASCGYFVICLSHDDCSSCYTPKTGAYDTSKVLREDYKTRNLQVKMRENEILCLCDEVMKPGFLETLCLDWKHFRLTKDLVLMGHSFGGITSLGAF